MKKLISTLFLLFFTAIFSQEYHFTTHCTLKETQLKGWYKNSSRQIQVYYNLTTPNYIAYIYPKENLRLYDYQQNILRVFDINYFNNYNKLKLLLEGEISVYEDGRNIKRITVEDLGNNNYLVKTFENIKNKRNNLEIKFELEKSDYPLVKIKFLDLSKNIHDKIYESLISKLPDANYQLKSIYYDYKNGVIMSSDFSNCKKINLKFDLNFAEKK